MSVDIVFHLCCQHITGAWFCSLLLCPICPHLLSMFVRSVENAQSLGIAFLGGVTATILTLFWDNEDSTLAMPYSQTLATKLVAELV